MNPGHASETPASDTTDLVKLPLVLTRKIFAFLSPRDCLNLSQTCRSWDEKPALSALSPLPICAEFTREGDYRTGDQTREAFRIPILWNHRNPDRLHSVIFKCEWQDQGWGNQKGQVYILARQESDAVERKGGNGEDFSSGGRIVYTSPIVPHEKTTLIASFHPLPGETYHLWYRVGGGGGHALHLYNVELIFVVFDDKEHTFGRNYNILYKDLQALDPLFFDPPSLAHDASRKHPGAMVATGSSAALFYPQLLFLLVVSLRQQNAKTENENGSEVLFPGSEMVTSLCAPLLLFLTEAGIKPTERSLFCVEEIIRELMDADAKARLGDARLQGENNDIMDAMMDYEDGDARHLQLEMFLDHENQDEGCFRMCRRRCRSCWDWVFGRG